MNLWLLLLLMGLITFGLRLSLIAMAGRLEVPPFARRVLRLVPAAVLSAIIFPEVLRPGGELNLSTANLRLLAAVLAALVAWRTRNVVATVGVGMAALWILQAVVR